MSENHLAFVFPAFTSDYTDHPGIDMPGFDHRFNELLNKAALSVDTELANFNFTGKTFLDDELRTQFLTYIYSCTVSSLLREARYAPSMNAGYSMGIYAALFDSGAVSFETGLSLIRIAYQCLHAMLKNRTFSMGTLIGLSRSDIQQLIVQSSLQIEITNQNASHSFVVSGGREDVNTLLVLAKDEGALHVRNLDVSIPYHSSFLKEGAMNFSGRIKHLKVNTPTTPIISLIDQVSLTSDETIRQELTRNLYHPLNWLHTIGVMQENNIKLFFECGPSKGLTKNAKFVDGIRFSPLPSRLP